METRLESRWEVEGEGMAAKKAAQQETEVLDEEGGLFGVQSSWDTRSSREARTAPGTVTSGPACFAPADDPRAQQFPRL